MHIRWLQIPTIFSLSAFVVLTLLSGQTAFAQWNPVGAPIEGEAESDYSGFSVALNASGSRVAIGSPYNDSNGNDAGHVRVYGWDGSTWSQVGSDIDGAAGDYSGWSVSLSADGDRLAVGAPKNNSATGLVRVYDWDGIRWIQVGHTINGETANDESGYSVALSADGSRLVVGEPYRDQPSHTYLGRARVFNYVDPIGWGR